MPIKRYMPSSESIKEEYAREVRRKLRERKHGPRPKSRITDNSTPWMENPRTVSDLWEIAQNVQALADKWGPKDQN
jgi:hypothetical protein